MGEVATTPEEFRERITRIAALAAKRAMRENEERIGQRYIDFSEPREREDEVSQAS